MNRTKIAFVLATAAVAIAGGSAFTASITGVPLSKTIGASSTTITGAASTAPVYTYDAGKTVITSIAFTLTGDTHASTVTATTWIDTTAGGAGNAFGVPITCSPGAVTSGPVTTPYTCDTHSAASDWTLTNVYRIDYAVV